MKSTHGYYSTVAIQRDEFEDRTKKPFRNIATVNLSNYDLEDIWVDEKQAGIMCATSKTRHWFPIEVIQRGETENARRVIVAISTAKLLGQNLSPGSHSKLIKLLSTQFYGANQRLKEELAGSIFSNTKKP